MKAFTTWWGETPWVTRWQRVAPVRRRQVWAVLLVAVGLAFPFVVTGGGHVDAAANAYTWVVLALGLNIVVGFAGLLDLGYAAFFAIGAYGYGAAASGQLKIPWSDVWTPLLWLGQVRRVPIEGGAELVQLQISFWAMLVVGAMVCALFSSACCTTSYGCCPSAQRASSRFGGSISPRIFGPLH